jgi:diguanylate cyclase (GGDEF)-like protein/PAS domain S-box-containing protein
VGTPIRILIVEDSADDAEILLWELRREGFSPEWLRAETAQQMESALAQQEWDVIVADYVMPRFSGLEALKIVQGNGLDIPFIMVSGKIGEETAVEVMRAGAHDYLLKGNLARLAPAIRRELAEVEVRAQRARVERELRLLKQAIETIPIGVTIADGEGRILYTNPAEASMHGYAINELIGEYTRVFAPAQAWSAGQLPISDYFTSSRESINVHKDGTVFPVYLISTPVSDGDGDLLGVVSVCEDITSRKQVEALLRKQQAAMESSIDGMVITDEGGQILYVNQAQTSIYGYDRPHDLIGRTWKVFYGESEVARIAGDILTHLASEGKWRGEAIGLRRDQLAFPQEISLTVMEGGGTIWVVRDITERKRTEEKLRFMSTHDSLTGLYNRAFFELELERLDRSRQFPVSAVMVDVDGLKMVNDTKGHAAGDKLLQQAAKVLSAVFRVEDMVARIGGDEFVVLLPESDAAAVDKALQRIRSTIAENCHSCNETGVSLSLGAATATEQGTLLQAIKLADERMYQDKLSRSCRDRQVPITALR